MKARADIFEDKHRLIDEFIAKVEGADNPVMQADQVRFRKRAEIFSEAAH